MNIRISALACVLSLAAQETEPQATIKTTVDEVVLDVVVRDKKGKPIKDLAASDIEVVDNGQKQRITGFRLVEGPEAIDQAGRTALDPLRQTRLVTLVFERMDQEQRFLAKQAALDVIKEPAPNAYYAVVAIDAQLFVLQNFTRDREALKKAIERCTSGQYNQYAIESDRIKTQLQETLKQQAQGAASSVQQAPALAAPQQGAQQQMDNAGSDAVNQKLAEVMRDMTRFDQAFAGDNTRMSIFSLLSLVRGQASMPGRKTILYFTWGMFVPPHLDDAFRSVISTANRGNVTFYAVDTKGVTTWNQNSSAQQQMLRAAQISAADITRDDGRVSKEAMLASDIAEQSTRNNIQLPLRNLSDSTGGFLIGDTNDLRKPLRQVAEEINSYYEITYNPGITSYDGSFRQTKVDVNRKDLVVHARNGYFALPPDLRGPALLPYEVPLLKALDSRPLPRDVEFRAAAVRFEQTPSEVEGQLVVEVPMGGLQFTEDTAKQTYKARVSLVSLVKDQKGEVVKKFTRDLPLSGPVPQAALVKGGNFIYKEPLELPPGRYTLETAVIDHEANKVGAKKAALVLRARTGGVAVSSLSMIRNYQAGVKDLDPEDPFQFQGGKVTPTLNAQIHPVKGAQLSMFFVVYPDPAIPDKPQAMMEYIKDGQSVGRGEVPLPAPDAQGRIPYVMSAPAETLAPGMYEVRVVVKQGNTAAEDRAFVTVLDK
jgi:VWFA-related protein